MNESNLPVDTNTKPKQKRSKISYSCLKCREKRTKCDRKLPCSSCKIRKSKCDYDTSIQSKPKRPNKDSLIIRLSKQLEFYKNMACKYTPRQELSVFSEDIEAIEYALGVRTLKKNMHSDSSNPYLDYSPSSKDSGSYINAHASDENSFGNETSTDRFIQLKRVDNDKHINVFSNVYIFKNDDYLNVLFYRPDKEADAKKNSPTEIPPNPKQTANLNFATSSNVYKNGINEKNSKKNNNSNNDDKNNNKNLQVEGPAKLKFFSKPDIHIFQNLLNNNSYTSDFQKQQASKFFTKLYETTNNIPPKAKKIQSNDVFSTFKFPGIVENTIEDIIVSQPSAFLSNIIVHITQKLPKSTTLMYLKKLYIEQLFVEFPFFNIEKFEDILSEILVVDGEVVSLNIVGSNIHLKMSALSLLLLILYCSDLEEKTRLHSNTYDENFDEYLELASHLLMATDFFSQPTEYKLSVLCQFWMIIYVTPDPDYSADLITSLPTDILAAMIEKLAANIGIKADMEDDSHIIDVDLRNFRKMLSVTITFITLLESVMKGQIFDKPECKISNNPEIYHELENASNFENHFFLYFQRRNNCLKMIHECMQLFSSKDDRVNATFLERKVDILDQYATKYFNLSNLKDLNEGGEGNCYTFSSKKNRNKVLFTINANHLYNSFIFNAVLFYKSCILKMHHVLFISYESKAFSCLDEEANNMFMKHINTSLKIAIDCVLMNSNFINKKYSPYLGLHESTSSNFVVLNMCSNMLLNLLQFVCKCFIFKVHLQMMIMNNRDYSPQLQVEMHLIDEMNTKTTKIMFRAFKEYASKFRFYHYHSFKLCLFFDFFKQTYEDGTLFNVIFNTKLKHDPYSPLPKEICDHLLMRRYLKNYYYLDYFKEATFLLNKPEVTEYIKDCANVNCASFHPADEFYSFQKSSTQQPHQHHHQNENYPNFSDENFNFEEYLRQLELQNMNFFGSSFMF